MKKIYFIFIGFLLSIILASCGRNDDQLSVSKNCPKPKESSPSAAEIAAAKITLDSVASVYQKQMDVLKSLPPAVIPDSMEMWLYITYAKVDKMELYEISSQAIFLRLDEHRTRCANVDRIIEQLKNAKKL